MIFAYNARFERRPIRLAPWPDAWQTHLQVTSALAASPLFMLVCALLIPTSSSLFQVVYALGFLSLLLVSVAYIWVLVRFYG